MADEAQVEQENVPQMDVVITEETLQMNPEMVEEGLEVGDVIQVDAHGKMDEGYVFLHTLIVEQRRSYEDALSIFKLRYPDSPMGLDEINDLFN